VTASAGERLAAFAPKRAGSRSTGDQRRAAGAELRADRRLSQLSLEVQVRPCGPGADRPAPCAGLQVGAHRAVRSSIAATPVARSWPGRLEASFVAAWSNEGFLTREHEEARLSAGRAALARFGPTSLRRAASSPPTSSASSRSVSTVTGSRPLGPRRHRGGGGPGATSDGIAARRRVLLGSVVGRCGRADAAAAPTRTGDDHRLQSSDVRDPAVGARARDRSS
jgi:hypothetical protein